MFRSAASKVMWVGRATVFLVGLAVILALVFGVASTAFAHKGNTGFFHLGHKNVSKAVSTLVKQGPGPALNLVVKAGQPPLKVNSSGKVANLNADKLDGKSDTDFYAAGSKVADSAHADQADNATNAGNANTLDNKDSGEFVQNTGEMTFSVFDSWMSSHSPSDPVTVDYRGNWTTFTRGAGGQATSEVRLAPPLPSSLYGKSMLLTGMEICYNTSDAAVALSRVKLLRYSSTTDGTGGNSVVDDFTPTDGNQCRMYSGTPQLMGTNSYALLEMQVNWSESTSQTGFTIARTTFFLEPSNTAAAPL